MDKIITRLENFIEKIISEFETNPFKSGLKAVIAFYILKKIYESFK